MNIVTWNANSLNESKSKLVTMFMHTHKPLILAITETKLPAPTLPPKISGYTAHHFHASGNREGGLAIYISNSIPQSRLHVPDNLHSNLALWITAQLPGTATSSNIGLIYRQESKRITGWHSLENNISWALSQGKPTIALGDFNAAHKSWSTLSHRNKHIANAVASFFDTHSLTILNSHFDNPAPTSKHANVTIDLIATTSPELFVNTAVLDDTLLLSDHYAVSASLIPSHPPSDHPKSRLVWMFAKANYDGYKNYLSHALSNWETNVFSPLTSLPAPAPPPDVSMFESWRAANRPPTPNLPAAPFNLL